MNKHPVQKNIVSFGNLFFFLFLISKFSLLADFIRTCCTLIPIYEWLKKKKDHRDFLCWLQMIAYHCNLHFPSKQKPTWLIQNQYIFMRYVAWTILFGEPGFLQSKTLYSLPVSIHPSYLLIYSNLSIMLNSAYTLKLYFHSFSCFKHSLFTLYHLTVQSTNFLLNLISLMAGVKSW